MYSAYLKNKKIFFFFLSLFNKKIYTENNVFDVLTSGSKQHHSINMNILNHTNNNNNDYNSSTNTSIKFCDINSPHEENPNFEEIKFLTQIQDGINATTKIEKNTGFKTYDEFSQNIINNNINNANREIETNNKNSANKKKKTKIEEITSIDQLNGFLNTIKVKTYDVEEQGKKTMFLCIMKKYTDFFTTEKTCFQYSNIKTIIENSKLCINRIFDTFLAMYNKEDFQQIADIIYENIDEEPLVLLEEIDNNLPKEFRNTKIVKDSSYTKEHLKNLKNYILLFQKNCEDITKTLNFVETQIDNIEEKSVAFTDLSLINSPVPNPLEVAESEVAEAIEKQEEQIRIFFQKITSEIEKISSSIKKIVNDHGNNVDSILNSFFLEVKKELSLRDVSKVKIKNLNEYLHKYNTFIANKINKINEFRIDYADNNFEQRIEQINKSMSNLVQVSFDEEENVFIFKNKEYDEKPDFFPNKETFIKVKSEKDIQLIKNFITKNDIEISKISNALNSLYKDEKISKFFKMKNKIKTLTEEKKKITNFLSSSQNLLTNIKNKYIDSSNFNINSKVLNELNKELFMVIDDIKYIDQSINNVVSKKNNTTPNLFEKNSISMKDFEYFSKLSSEYLKRLNEELNNKTTLSNSFLKKMSDISQKIITRVKDFYEDTIFSDPQVYEIISDTSYSRSKKKQKLNALFNTNCVDDNLLNVFLRSKNESELFDNNSFNFIDDIFDNMDLFFEIARKKYNNSSKIDLINGYYNNITSILENDNINNKSDDIRYTYLLFTDFLKKSVAKLNKINENYKKYNDEDYKKDIKEIIEDFESITENLLTTSFQSTMFIEEIIQDIEDFRKTKLDYFDNQSKNIKNDINKITSEFFNIQNEITQIIQDTQTVESKISLIKNRLFSIYGITSEDLNKILVLSQEEKNNMESNDNEKPIRNMNSDELLRYIHTHMESIISQTSDYITNKIEQDKKKEKKQQEESIENEDNNNAMDKLTDSFEKTYKELDKKKENNLFLEYTILFNVLVFLISLIYIFLRKKY